MEEGSGEGGFPLPTVCPICCWSPVGRKRLRVWLTGAFPEIRRRKKTQPPGMSLSGKKRPEPEDQEKMKDGRDRYKKKSRMPGLVPEPCHGSKCTEGAEHGDG